MDNTWIFIWGFIATLFAIGPLTVAAILDYRARRRSPTGSPRLHGEAAGRPPVKAND